MNFGELKSLTSNYQKSGKDKNLSKILNNSITVQKIINIYVGISVKIRDNLTLKRNARLP